jgi:hypothetical protein
MVEPAVPNWPQYVLQHFCAAVSVLMFVLLHAVQTVPSTAHCEFGIGWQVPAPVAPIWQIVVQQSDGL